MSKSSEQPIVYACSGCSNVAQLANQLALKLNQEGLAEMSCIAGVGGKVKSIVKLARSGRPILALDGCALHCARHCLAGVDVEADMHLTLTDFKLRKQKHQDFDPEDLKTTFIHIESELQKL